MTSSPFKHRVTFALVAVAVSAMTARIVAQVADEVRHLPASSTVHFVENAGQWSDDLRFAAQADGVIFRMMRTGLRASAPASKDRLATIDLSFGGTACGMPDPVGRSPNAARHNYFIGSDPARWQSGVRAWSEVQYPSVWPGVDATIGSADRVLRVSFHVAEGTDTASIGLRMDGSSSLWLDAAGSLRAETVAGPLRVVVQSAHQPLEAVPGAACVQRACQLSLQTGGRIAFTAPDRDLSLPLVINLGLEWATFLGGSSSDYVRAIALAPSGEIVVTGETGSPDFPVSPGAYDVSHALFFDTYVAKLDATGTELIAATYIGGAQQDYPGSVAIASDGALTVAGFTSSPDFPTTPGAYDQTFGLLEDFYVARLSADLSELLWSTLVGADASNPGEVSNRLDMVQAPDDSVYIMGICKDGTYPVTPGAYDTTPTNPIQGPGDIVISHISADGSALLHSTFFGGSFNDQPRGLCLLPDGLVIAGEAPSPDFPTTPGAFDETPPGEFVAKLDLTLSRLMYSTILKSQLGGGASLLNVAADPSGSVTVVGETTSTSWPTTPGAFDTTFGGGNGNDAFVTKVNATGSALVYSTYLGSASSDGAWAVTVDSAGVATVVGYTYSSSSFPVTAGAWDLTSNGSPDAFVARFSPDGRNLWYATYLGGANSDADQSQRMDIADLEDGGILVGAGTASRDFPVTDGAFDTTFGGFRDGYLARLSMLPAGVTRYGDSTEGCGGYLAMGVTAMPRLGQPFSMTCRNAPPASSQGLLALGASELTTPLIAKGAAFWVNPAPILLLLPMSSDAVGFAELGGVLPVTPGLAGVSFTAQSFWPDLCAPSGPYSASNALFITLQP